jgi:hypothetical protein
MKKFLSLAAAVFATAANAGGCDEAMIRSVARGGNVIILDSGARYGVEPDDTSDTALWSAGDSVLVCDDGKMINRDNDDSKVHVVPLR